MKNIIETNELAERIANGENVKLIDASYALPGHPVSPLEQYRQVRIGNAAFFDIDAIADRANDLPHMLPGPDAFEEAVSKLGIGNDDTIVVYDQTGIAMAAARVWWTFRVFGHDNIAVLNGGLPAWIAAGHNISNAPPEPPAPKRFEAKFRPELVKNMQDIRIISERQDADTLILDARSPARFKGEEPEPRPGMLKGSIPGSHNAPFMDLIDLKTGCLKDKEALEQYFRAYDLTKDIITTCGSGVTACVVNLALHTIGATNAAVYDGSWAEWGQANHENNVA